MQAQCFYVCVSESFCLCVLGVEGSGGERETLSVACVSVCVGLFYVCGLRLAQRLVHVACVFV